ncbi:hypothetical protein [Clostridium perfringens]|uniref:hypothetical protein n=1 Tax=Clostridium perfringens TaxID=1502 RepID=UPI003F41FC03
MNDKKIIMDKPEKLKITLIRQWRINFRYKSILYSLQHCNEEYEDSVDLKIFENNRWKYINSIDCMDIYDMHIIKDIFNKDFKQDNIVYKHVDKRHFLRTLHKFGLIDAGDTVELEILVDKLRENRKKIKDIEQRYYKELEKYNFFNSKIEENIAEIINRKQIKSN